MIKKLLNNVVGLYEELAEITGNTVWCRHCKKEEKIGSAYCFKHGWPKCCGYTMTIDHPSKW